ncbi:MAG: acetate--CoA ligase [Thaumarchaeota archaeon]|nr:acetate--CoA ligase [Nitrososphaerota archaeon]
MTLSDWNHRNVSVRKYFELHKDSIENIQEFWASKARELEWLSPWTKISEPGAHPHVTRWFPGGRINISHLCLDRHVSGKRRNKLSLIWEGEPRDEKGGPMEVRKYTYYELLTEVNRVAYAFRNELGLKRGDKAALYMPMIPELPIFLLALARLGVVFTAVFSGFSAENLALRIKDLGARTILTADGFYRRGKVIKLKETVDGAVSLSATVESVVVVKRAGLDVHMTEGRDHWLHDLLEGAPSSPEIQPEPVESDSPLYVLYTSGTTGGPKGIIHDHGGYATLLHTTMKEVFDMKDEDVYYCTADIGWVTGHSYIVFGPLLVGATTIMYEGTPDYPAPDTWWAIIERYGVSIFYTTPTGTRMLMKFGDDPVKKHDLSTLRLIHSVGEPINPSAWRWLYDVVGQKRCPVGSTWWMTETGGIMISYAPGTHFVPMKPGANGPPLPGIDAEVVNEAGEPVSPGTKGFLVIKKPFPGMPSPPTGIWGDPERYAKVYFEKFPGKNYFYTGDYAVKDTDGYIWVAGRADEVLKVAGHRIGTYELESALVSHESVAEAAVVAGPDAVKGEVPIAFVVLKQGRDPTPELTLELKKWTKSKFGSIAEPSQLFFVSRLPKTRSGKIMRRLIKAVASGSPLGDVTTLEDEAAVDEVQNAYQDLKRAVERID